MTGEILFFKQNVFKAPLITKVIWMYEVENSSLCLQMYGVKLKRYQQVKYRYLKDVLKYSNKVFLSREFPLLLFYQKLNTLFAVWHFLFIYIYGVKIFSLSILCIFLKY